MYFALGNTETFVLAMEENLQRGLPGRNSCVLAGAAEWVVLIVYSLGINCCLMLSGITGTGLSTKQNANLQHQADSLGHAVLESFYHLRR